MKKVIIFVFLFFGIASGAYAYDLTLTKIGTMSTIGADYSLVSYLGSIPALEGTATPSAQVVVRVNTTSSVVTAATASGVWNYLPVTLNTGDNTVVVTSGSQQLNFVLRYNSSTIPTLIATNSATVTALPKTGAEDYVVVGLLVGIGVLFLGFEAKRRMRVWEKGG